LDEHIPETELSLYAFDPDAMSLARQNAIDQHAAACADCRATLDFFMVTEEELKDPEVWERNIGSATLDTLRDYAERIAAEDDDAERLLKPFFASPAETACTNFLALGKRYLNGGVVRRLNAHAHSLYENEPLDALTFADVAILIAESLPDDQYPARAVYELRGTAWKERANALLMLGRNDEALDTLTHAERAYSNLVSSALGLSIVALVRASVLYQQQKIEEAAAMAEKAEHGFAHLGDDERRVTALYLRGGIMYETNNLEKAAVLFRELIAYGEQMNNPLWTARGAYALGNCEVDRGDLAEASMHLLNALVIFRETGPIVDRVRTEWGVARVFLHGGKMTEAIRRLRDVAVEFETRGMITDAALVRLDIADALLALGQTRQIEELAAQLFGVFENAGMLTGALSALAYMKEAAATGKLTPTGVQSVRAFLRRAERQPELVFAATPDSSR
jgi:tetratricopeptide (TPR) repeat protein